MYRHFWIFIVLDFSYLFVTLGTYFYGDFRGDITCICTHLYSYDLAVAAVNNHIYVYLLRFDHIIYIIPHKSHFNLNSIAVITIFVFELKTLLWHSLVKVRGGPNQTCFENLATIHNFSLEGVEGIKFILKPWPTVRKKLITYFSCSS